MATWSEPQEPRQPVRFQGVMAVAAGFTSTAAVLAMLNWLFVR